MTRNGQIPGKSTAYQKTRIKQHCSSSFRSSIQPTDSTKSLKREEKTHEPKVGALSPLSDRQPAACGRWLAA